MRYFLLIFVVCVAAVIGIAGKRGTLSRKTPLYIFPDMKRQLKLRPEQPNDFFENGVSSQLPPAGTVVHAKPTMVAGQPVYPYEDSPVFTGRQTGTTNFVETNPFPVTEQLLKRGQERFNIYCSPCHGREADGNGITKKLGVMPTV
ncbi:MAG TPA: cytochrome c, partial [Verrucomicrobiae bacterium]|nr:cytochrome c [Verrucomicrobiae bacterium]